MKKFILILAAATLTASPVLAAPSQSHGQTGQSQSDRARSDQGQSAQRGTPSRQAAQAHQWKRGERFDRNRATNYRVISNPRAYKLQSAPKGYRWVQSGRDAMLVRLSNNIISSVVTGAIR